MPEAARITDDHECSKHGGGPIHSGSADVVIGYLPAARVSDSVVCTPVGPADSIQVGAATVLINNRSAARRTDPCAHGGRIVAGCPTVLIGDTPQSFALRAAARRGTPLCEDCPAPPLPTYVAADSDVTPRDPTTATAVGRSADDGHERRALARQEDQGDALDEDRRAARYSVAYKFYMAHAGGRVVPSAIWSHLQGIDFSRPVEVVDIGGETLYQRGVPGAPAGPYFARDPDLPPEALGVDGSSEPVPRDRRVFEFGDAPASALKSVAAAIAGAGQGGGTQWVVPAVFHAGAKIRLL
ncbi:MAG TPA: PAAR domain-containing protein [Nannocystis sp.]